MTGACTAARHDRTRLRRMNGKGSNGAPRKAPALRRIQMNITPAKERMNVQLPPNSATRSASRCPNVRLRSNSTFGFSERVSCSRSVRRTLRSRAESSPFLASSTSSMYSARKRSTQAKHTTLSAVRVGCSFRIRSRMVGRTISPCNNSVPGRDFPQADRCPGGHPAASCRPQRNPLGLAPGGAYCPVDANRTATAGRAPACPR